MAEEAKLGRSLTAAEMTQLRNNSLALRIEKIIHQTVSETYGGRNTFFKQVGDAADPIKAIRSNVNAYRSILQSRGYSNEEIDQVIEKMSEPFVQKQNVTKSGSID